MRFAHLADCHIGSWRDPKLRDVSTKAFLKAIDLCMEKKVDFILIAGDLFNTSLPSIDRLKAVVIKLRQLKENNIPVYIVPGSHDFSPSGKTILDVLEEADLLVNVVKGEVTDNKLKLKFTVDKKTGAKITGMLGKKGTLEKGYYERLIKTNLETASGFKIFMFHSAITELKPIDLSQIESAPISMLPKGFDYYAGGHVHFVSNSKHSKGIIAFPGPLFPNNFSELEKLGQGGLYIYENGKLSYEPVQILNVFSIKLDCNHKTPEEIEQAILNEIKNKEFINTIVTLRLEGKLKSGKTNDINFKSIFNALYNKSAYFVMKKTPKLISEEFEEIKINCSIEDIEDSLIKEHVGQIKFLNTEKEVQLTKKLMRNLDLERDEGERVSDFEERLKKNIDNILKI